MAEGKVRVLIADDSPVVREVLKDMIADEDDLELAGEAVNGRQAVEWASSLKPDIITMDVIMPILNGLEAVEEIMAYCPTPILVFSSVVSDKEMDVAFQSIARGALDVMEKPKVAEGDNYDRIRDDLLNKLRMLSRIHVIPHLKGKRRRTGEGRASREVPAAGRREAPGPAAPAVPAAKPGEPAVFVEPPEGMVKIPPERFIRRKLVAVGASTGGPKALVQIFKRVPGHFKLPILTVQHIAPSFAAGLVNWLNRESSLMVVLAEDKLTPLPGAVHVAPTGVHMVLERGIIRLTETPPVNSCRPSVDELFHSVSSSAGGESVGVLLTGMGRDGAEGLRAMRDAGSKTIVQDEASSVIYGMPRAAVELDAAEVVASLSDIPDAIMKAITH